MKAGNCLEGLVVGEMNSERYVKDMVEVKGSKRCNRPRENKHHQKLINFVLGR